jgi:hypothetical protein
MTPNISRAERDNVIQWLKSARDPRFQATPRMGEANRRFGALVRSIRKSKVK